MGSKNSQTTPTTTSTAPNTPNHWAPQTRKRHRQEHRPQRPTERSDPTQHAKGRTGDCRGPRKETTTRRNVTQGGSDVVERPYTAGEAPPPPDQRDHRGKERNLQIREILSGHFWYPHFWGLPRPHSGAPLPPCPLPQGAVSDSALGLSGHPAALQHMRHLGSGFLRRGVRFLMMSCPPPCVPWPRAVLSYSFFVLKYGRPGGCRWRDLVHRRRLARN